MKITIILYIVTTTLSNVYCENEGNDKNPFSESIKNIEEFAENDKIIDRVLKPWKQYGYLGKGAYGFGYKCDINGKTYAIKFVPTAKKYKVDREYRYYAGLEAITNSSVHQYGIPSLYFRGDITIGSKTFDAIGVKLLEDDFSKKMEEEYFKCLGSDGNPVHQLSDAFVSDFFNAYQQALIALIYAHNLGVQHNDLKPDCFRISGGRLYLFDWNAGERKDDEEFCKTGSRVYASRRGLAVQPRNENDEMESLHIVFSKIGGAILPWDRSTPINESIEIRNDKNKMIAICDTMNHPILVQFCKEHYEEVFQVPELRFPRYVTLYDLAEQYKMQLPHSLKYFSWLKPKDKSNANKNRLPNIKKMKIPTGTYNLKKPPVPFPDPRNDGEEDPGCQCAVI